MKIISFNRVPQQTTVRLLQDELEAVIDKFIDDHGEMPVALAVGVLRVVEHNLIARLE